MLVVSCDREKKFHPFGIAIAKGETEEDYEFIFKALKDSVNRLFYHEINATILLADGAPAIHNGFKKVFNLEKRIMCWFHVTHVTQTKLNANERR
ncbi:hypothetical protein BpHYR1_027621 [Brachionus plicatilis]|uniref:MULE transposase domain-containing protein n=1 Tax=Brachionus plicatilis TaxID=10195 RepID=A0A3M7S4U5_BRAPC|nr:hypothetical protein BpHYR1_027621 [Brachionus plicatilis]